MQSRIVVSKCAGYGFTAIVLTTISTNYAIGVICGNDCYPGNETPVEYPYHLFISATFRKSPTREIAVAGFMAAACLGFVMAIGRHLQIVRLATSLMDSRLERRLVRRSLSSFVPLTLFVTATPILPIFAPREDLCLNTIIHYASCFLTFVGFVVYIFMQLYFIERILAKSMTASTFHLEALLLHPLKYLHVSSAVTKSVVRSFPDKRISSYRFKVDYMLPVLCLFVGFFGFMNVWPYLEKGSHEHTACVLLSEILEVGLVFSGSLFLAVSDFTSVEKTYVDAGFVDSL